ITGGGDDVMDTQRRLQRSTIKAGSITSAINPEAKTSSSQREPLVPKLRTLEAKIERNRGRPLLMGRDLQIIRDQGDYNGTWDKYCKHRFRFSARAGNYYIAAWRTAENCGVPDHVSARALRPLTGLAPERQREAWATAVGMTRDGVPSAKMVEIAASALTRKQMAPWSLRAARQIVSLGLKRTLEKAYAWANDEQKAQLAAELEDLLVHVRELTGY
ncbi:MAG: hypothetical protein NT154_03630, partial [Verrucomicrobia bacterium]|nr:hypothetical protein [Verrucomicrobiota bacterium]